MKNLLITAGIIVALCGLSYSSFYALSRDSAEVRQAVKAGDAMEWLRSEFHLTDGQYAEIQSMHDGYYVECSIHCADIMAAQEEGKSAEEVTRLEAICESAMAEHCRLVAAVMNTSNGARYLKIVMPRIADYDHHEAPSLQINR